ncbi:MAG: type I glutamate--ammonia ligase [Phycisphaerae bacterium]|nr:type I glutamate--ammonia ligase [Phycisphaerae bacterium]
MVFGGQHVFENAAAALKYIKQQNVAMVDLKMVGIAGQWLHVTIPARQFSEKHFEEGVGYDGSSGAGFGKVESGDVVAIPEPQTAFIDPFWDEPTLSLLCGTATADTKEPFASDPRTIANRAVRYMQESGIADEAWMGPEYEFHIFNRVDVTNEPYYTGVQISAGEIDPDGRGAPLGLKQGYMRVPPTEHLHNLRSEICMTLEAMGVEVKYHHHEVGAPGQCEIEVNLRPLVEAADRAMLIKYVVKNIARRNGLVATFMPKPVYGEAGNGMHVHQKLEKSGRPLFFDDSGKNYANLSRLALQYTCGLLSHGEALAGFTNPSTNSYKRLIEGYEAPVNLFYSLANRSAAIRVPRYAIKPVDKRIEYRPPDFTGNVYLTLAAMLMAGLDGITSKIDIARNGYGPFDVNVEQQSDEFRAKIRSLPRTLYDALEALADDHGFLVAGNVFPEVFIHGWIDAKRRDETQAINIRPHPYEYQLYLDI